MSNAVQNAEPTQIVQPSSEAGAIIAMIERAATNPAVDIDKMERLFKMHGEVIARNAKTAYAAALAQMQPELPIIARRGQIGLGSNNAKNPMYARWEDINEAIRPVLAKHGFAISFRVAQNEGRINVTGVLSHREGHSEETTMSLPIDAGPGRNAVQAVGSSVSYGKRYAAAALLNLVSRGEDDDGLRSERRGPIIAAEVKELQTMIDAIGAEVPKVLAHVSRKIGEDITKLEEIPASQFQALKLSLSNWAKQKG